MSSALASMWTAAFRALLFSFPVFGSLLVVNEARAQCKTDMECKGSRICQAGECVDPPPVPADPPAAESPVGSVPSPLDTAQTPAPETAEQPVPAPASAPPAAAPQTAGTSPAPPAEPTTAATQSPALAQPAATESRPVNRALLVPGIITAASGYGLAVVGGIVGLAVDGANISETGGSCTDNAELNFIPLIGPALYAANFPDHSVVTYGGSSPTSYDCDSYRSVVVPIAIAVEALQLAGVGLIIGGFVFRKSSRGDTGGGRSLYILPGTTAAPLGLTVGFANL